MSALKKGEDAPLTVEWWPIDRPIPYARNARKLSARALDVIKASLQEFGWQQPIVCDSADVIVAGHTRLLGAKALGMTQVPVHVATDLTPGQVKAYRIMDNRSAQETTWDFDLLGPELFDLKAMDFDLGLTGFEAGELDGMLIKAGLTDGLTDEDATPEVPVVPVTVLGDLWLLGEHRVLCGDCREFGSIERLFAVKKANLVFTSPPYAKQREYDASSGFRPIQPGEYVEWYRDVAVNIASVLAADGSYFLNIKPSSEGTDTDLYVLELVLAHAREWGFHFATEFCWERNGVPKSVTQRFKNQFEPIYQFALGRWKMRPDEVRHASENVPRAGGAGSGETSWAKKQGGTSVAESVSGSFGGAKKRRNGTSKMISEIQGTSKDAGEFIGPGMAYPGNRLPTFAGTHDATGHAASFPVGLPDFFIRAYTDHGDTVFDPFLGSGSTLMATEKNGRIGYGTELSPQYVDVIVNRWQQFTGKQATLEGDGRTFDALKAERLPATVAA
jgi:DNA modification methylase